MRTLMNESEKVIIVGHGMGSLLALVLAANSRDSVDSLVLTAPSIALPKPLWTQLRLLVLKPSVQHTFKRWTLPPSYTDRKQGKTDTNYRWAPMESLHSFFELIEMTRGRLSEIKAPTLILQSTRDSTVSPEAPEIILKGIGTPNGQKRIQWFNKSGHELFRDCEREEVSNVVVNYLMERVG